MDFLLNEVMTLALKLEEVNMAYAILTTNAFMPNAFIRSSHQGQPMWWPIIYLKSYTKAKYNDAIVATIVESWDTFHMTVRSYDLVQQSCHL